LEYSLDILGKFSFIYEDMPREGDESGKNCYTIFIRQSGQDIFRYLTTKFTSGHGNLERIIYMVHKWKCYPVSTSETATHSTVKMGILISISYIACTEKN
jgi:L-rhamnose mutarotase